MLVGPVHSSKDLREATEFCSFAHHILPSPYCVGHLYSLYSLANEAVIYISIHSLREFFKKTGVVTEIR